MKFILIALLFRITFETVYARQSTRVVRDSDAETTTAIVQTTLNYDTEELKELIKNKTVESATILISKVAKQASQSRMALDNEESSKTAFGKAYACSRLNCPAEEKINPVCACNFNTGNVASFKNKCDAQKHNCRFDTNFKVILEEICPWEFAFRRNNKEYEFDYRDPKYYN